VPDCTQLLVLTDDTVVDNLRLRYEADEVHTNVGSMLVVLNPYRELPIYEEAQMNSHVGVRLANAQPHVFAIAEEAYLSLMRSSTSQAILVSGESGAGKTETSKRLVQYISFRARKDPSKAASKLADALVRSNPSLEAFGNASNTRNANSSRFAKFVQLHVSNEGELTKASIATFLLEKTRVASHAAGERNYHIFYQV
ncbi:P-loop containing nucleoside triphosphate hydrolase protein, partial [Pavlovales sp. CCMP2436]